MALIRESPLLVDILGQAPQLYLSINTKSGPLVTPELYSMAGDRLWCLTARSTAKVRLTNDDDIVGVAVMTAKANGALVATVEQFDPLRPTSILKKLDELGEAAAGVTAFLSRNGIEMAGAARDAVLGRLGVVPEPRALLALEPTRSFTDESSGPATTVVGWLAGDVPLALPAEWVADEGVARVGTALFDAFGADESGPASFCFDQWTGLGPSGKQGSVLRGQGVASRDGDSVTITLDVERTTTWDGVDVD